MAGTSRMTKDELSKVAEASKSRLKKAFLAYPFVMVGMFVAGYFARALGL